MLGTRYEEYISFNDNLPFKLTLGITITPQTYSHEANWHENLEIQFCTEGCGYVLMDKENHDIIKNHVAVVNSNVIHHTNTADMIKYDCLIIDTAFCTQMGINTSFLFFEPCFYDTALWENYKKLVTVYKNTDDICRTAKLNEIILKILIELRENHTIDENKSAVKTQSFETIKKAIKYIRENYTKKLYLDKIAQNVFVDKYTLSREFKKITNQTVIQYVNSYRCKKASDYISNGMSVSDAARTCGFTNMSFFTKTFKQYMGCMPHTCKTGKNGNSNIF